MTRPPLVVGWNLIDRLFGLSGLSLFDEGAGIGWRQELPAWAWILIAMGAITFAGWSYSRMFGPKWARAALGGVRTLLILFVVALLAGPMLVVRQERVDEDWLLMLVDRSASMTVRDMPAPHPGPGPAPGPGNPPSGGGETLISRDELIRRQLTRNAAVFGPQGLGHQRRILWLGFDSGTYEIPAPLDAASALQPAEGGATAIRTAIEQAMQRAAGRPISGIVLISDGRSPQSTGPELVRRLQQQAVSVFSVPLGAQIMPLDLSIARIDAPSKAFINDVVPVNVWVDRYPFDAAVDAQRVTVRLVDAQTGKLLDERRLGAGEIDQVVRLTARPTVAGAGRWRVEIVYHAPPDAPAQQQELITENNTRVIDLELIDRPLRVLYVEGYPRWEYRYLKTLLIREQSIDSSMMLISADRAFAQEGDSPISRLPQSPEELRPYDVVILGDVPSNYFSPEQLTLLRDHVANEGAGLLWIGGAYSNPRAYEGTALAGLLPMRQPSQTQRLDPSLGPLYVRPTAIAEALSVLRLGSPEDLAGGKLWPEALPGLLWAQQIGPLKATAEVLATAGPRGGDAAPLAVRMRYGAGEVLYIASDDTWRWRYRRGELYFEQFWTQLVRMLGRSRLQQGQDRVRLELSHRRVELDQPVVVDLRLEDALLARRGLPRVSVEVVPADAAGPGGGGGAGGPAVERFELTPHLREVDGPDARAAGPAEETRRDYQAIWRPTTPGRLVVRIADPALADLEASQSIEVTRSDDELRQPAPDHQRLASLAEQTGGATIAPADLASLQRLIPNRAKRTPNDLREPLWHSPIAMTLLVILLTGEWIGRKVIRLA